MKHKSHRPHLRRAIEMLGSQDRLARAAGYSQKAISWALIRARRMSPEMAVAIEKATGGEVKRSELRSDLWEEA